MSGKFIRNDDMMDDTVIPGSKLNVTLSIVQRDGAILNIDYSSALKPSPDMAIFEFRKSLWNIAGFVETEYSPMASSFE